MASPRQVTTALLLGAAVLVAGFGYAVLHNRPKLGGSEPTVRSDDPARGSADPQVTIIEFGDFQCEFCRDSADALSVALAQTSVPVRHVWKDAPLSTHGQALPAAVAARCAHEQGRFWEYHDRLLKRQAELGPNLYTTLMADLQLDPVAFGTCQADPVFAERVRASNAEAQALRVTDLPTLFVNGRRITGALTATSLRAIIEVEAAAGKPP